MAEGPDDKTPPSIKLHTPKLTLEMGGSPGSQVRAEVAREQVEKERQSQIGDRAGKYAKLEKLKLGEKGRLGKEFKEPSKDKDRDR